MILAARALEKRYGGTAAVAGVSLEVSRGECVAVVGGSGSGKSTLARLLVRLERPSRGRVLFDGRDITELPDRELAPVRRRLQIVFQDPGSALDPRMTVEAILREPLEIHRLDAPSPAESLARVGLPPKLLSRFPHQLSGGQKQRTAIARALALSPEVLVLDEPLSALDAGAKDEILALLRELREARLLTYVFIAHDLRAVRLFASRVLVMHRGLVVEDKPAEALFAAPEHAHTRALIRATER